MKINSFSGLNFGAKYIEQVDVKKYNPKSTLYDSASLSFVEFDPINKRDTEAIANAVKTWKGQDYAGMIAQNANLVSNGFLSPEVNHIYLMTSQTHDFDNLDSKKILGLAQMQTGVDEEDNLRYFQVRPDLKHGIKNRRYKNIGSGMLDSLKKIYNKAITLIASYSAANFYELQGFEIRNTDLFEYIWRSRRKM